jgi:hypothetical protein
MWMNFSEVSIIDESNGSARTYNSDATLLWLYRYSPTYVILFFDVIISIFSFYYARFHFF